MVKKSTSVRCRIGDTELDASAGKVVERNVEVIQVVDSSKRCAIVVTGADPDEHYQRQTSHLRGGFCVVERKRIENFDGSDQNFHNRGLVLNSA